MFNKSITVGMFTARDDFSMLGYPGLHIFEYLMQSLRQQTYKKFDVVICDLLYEQRKDYFKQHPEKFRVKHVPVKPNIWTPRNYYAISTCRNTCILHATGDYIILIGDCVSLAPHLLGNAVKLLRKADYLYTACENRLGDEFKGYSINPHAPIGFGHSGLTTRLELLEELNGYDEGYDGCKGYEDGDIAWRLGHSGVKVDFNQCLMTHQMHGKANAVNKVLRCAALWGPIVLDRALKLNKWDANRIPLSDEEYNKFAGKCWQMDEKGGCIAYRLADGSTLYCEQGNIDKRIGHDFELYRHSSLIFDLKKQRNNVDKALKELEELCQK